MGAFKALGNGIHGGVDIDHGDHRENIHFDIGRKKRHVKRGVFKDLFNKLTGTFRKSDKTSNKQSA
jgi:hypothetical protein